MDSREASPIPNMWQIQEKRKMWMEGEASSNSHTEIIHHVQTPIPRRNMATLLSFNAVVIHTYCKLGSHP